MTFWEVIRTGSPLITRKTYLEDFCYWKYNEDKKQWSFWKGDTLLKWIWDFDKEDIDNLDWIVVPATAKEEMYLFLESGKSPFNWHVYGYWKNHEDSWYYHMIDIAERTKKIKDNNFVRMETMFFKR